MPTIPPPLKGLVGLGTAALLMIVAGFAWQSLARVSAVAAPGIETGAELPDPYSPGVAAPSPAANDAAAAAARALPTAPGGASAAVATRTFTTRYDRLLAPARARLEFEKMRVETGYGIVIRDTVLPILQTLLAALLAYLFAVPAAKGLAELATAARLRAAAHELDAQTRSAAAQEYARTKHL